jgi:hypothetical protein
MELTFKKIKQTAKDYYPLMLFLLAIFGLLGIFGLNPNIPKFWNGLDIEGKILFMGFLNFLWATFIFVVILSRINSKKNGK